MCPRTTHAAVLGTNNPDKLRLGEVGNVRVFFKLRTRLSAPPGVFGRAGSHPGDDGSRNKRESGHLRPRFAGTPRVITARDRAKTRTRQRLNFCCAPRIYQHPPPAKVKGWTRISSAQEPLRPMPLPRASRVPAARRSAKRPRNGVRLRAHAGWHALHAALPAKSGRTRPPLPIPSAAKFHPPTEKNRPRPN